MMGIAFVLQQCANEKGAALFITQRNPFQKHGNCFISEMHTTCSS